MVEAPARVLLVDEDGDERAALESLLDIDFEVTAAKGPGEAAQLLEERDFDVVLTDGGPLLSWMHDKQPGLLAIVLTKNPDQPAVKNAESEGTVVRVVEKPFDARRLTALIQSAALLSRTNRGLGAARRVK